MDRTVENLFYLNEFMKVTYGHYPVDVVHLIVMIYWDFFQIKISCGAYHNFMLVNGNVYAWGQNARGQLGLGHNTDKNFPQKVFLNDVTEISCAWGHSLALTSDGKVYAWGENICQFPRLNINTPREMCIPIPIAKIYCGYNHCVVVGYDGVIFVWGSNNYGQLGLGDYQKRETPSIMENYDLVNLLEVVGYSYHSIALRSDGKIYGWGDNGDGQLGIDTGHHNVPKQIDLNNIIKISSGYRYTIALDTNGEVYVWGTFGNIIRGKPQKIGLSNIIEISSGFDHVLALTIRGKVYAWRKNADGQLGLDYNKDQAEPVLTEMKNIMKIHCGTNHSIVVSKFKKIYVWGRNEIQELKIDI